MRNRLAIVGVVLAAGFAVGAALADSGDKGTCQQSKAASCAKATSGAKAAEGDGLKPQTVCPIMGGKIDRDVFVDAAGYRFYACCSSCLDKIKADPAKALATLKDKGEKPELRLVVCPKCGEIQGTAKCCQPEAVKCSKCGLDKGSIGCCKDLKPAAGKTCPVTGAKCASDKDKPGASDKDKPKCCSGDKAKSDSGCTRAKAGSSCCAGQKSAADQKDVVICPCCGEVQGSEKCCQTDAKICPKCGLHEGSPGCCKLGEFVKSSA